MKNLSTKWAIIGCDPILSVPRLHENEFQGNSKFNVRFNGKQARIVFDTYGSMPTKFPLLIKLPARFKSFNRRNSTVKIQ